MPGFRLFLLNETKAERKIETKAILPKVKNEFFSVSGAKSDALNSGGFVVDCIISQKAKRGNALGRQVKLYKRSRNFYIFLCKTLALVGWGGGKIFEWKALFKWQSIHESLQFHFVSLGTKIFAAHTPPNPPKRLRSIWEILIEKVINSKNI